MITSCPGRDSNSQGALAPGDFESFPAQSEDSARSSVGQSDEVSQSLTESQFAATPVCYSAPLTIGSLFSGIGGLELGLEWAGLGPVVWQVEQDDYCRRVLAKHWPDATRHEDVRCVGAQNLEPVDVICGGFPCQDISIAGRGAGLAGSRSGLWVEYARIIRELRPCYVVVENVPALFVRGFGTVLGDLAAIGYDAEWQVLSAQGVGAPHLRERVFILAYTDSPRQLQSEGCESDQRRRISDGCREKAVADTAGARCSAGESEASRSVRNEAWRSESERRGGEVAHADSTGRSDTPRGAGSPARGRPIACTDDAERGAHDWCIEPDVGRVAHGVPARVDRLRALGNAVVPQVAEIVGHVILARENAKRGVA